MIAVCYTGDKRYNYTLTLQNHKKLLDQLSKLGKVNTYWFTKDSPERGVCPYDDNSPDESAEGRYRRGQGGAVQLWDFINAMQKVKETIVIRMRTDTWFTDGAIEIIENELKNVIAGETAIAFFGSDLVNNNVGKDYERIFVNPEHISRIQDFIIITDKTKIRTPQEMIDNIEKVHPKKRSSGNKIFRFPIIAGSNAYTILCKIYLIRKFYETEPSELDIFEDYLNSYADPMREDIRELLSPAYSWLTKARRKANE
jgi:hypothetical protein